MTKENTPGTVSDAPQEPTGDLFPFTVDNQWLAQQQKITALKVANEIATSYGARAVQDAIRDAEEIQAYIYGPSTWQARLRDEYEKLGDKIVNLDEFTSTEKFRTLDAEIRELMTTQLHVMGEYADILERRVNRLGTKTT